MTILVANVPHETNLGFVEVENQLPPGKYRFRLTVFDEAKNESEPAFIVVAVNEVQRDPRPDPRIDLRPDPRIDPRPDPRIDPRIDPRVVIDRRVIDRVVVNPGVGDVVRPVRPIFPRRPGG